MADVQSFLEQLSARLAQRRAVPLESTYRLQFHKAFTFRDATEIVPYLHDLGITHVYASPYLKARAGSTHGYDVIDHCTLNPELGTREDFDAFVATLQKHGMTHILDTVPNHVGVGTNDNTWWNDVLENGPGSRYAGYFDIDWQGSSRPQLHGKVLLPVLGEPYGDALESGKLKLSFERGGFFISYYDRRFPISPQSYGRILGHRQERLRGPLADDPASLEEFRSILTFADDLEDSVEDERGRSASPIREGEQIKQRLTRLIDQSPVVRKFIGENLADFQGKPGDPRSFDALDGLLNQQFYRLSYWRVAPDEINYRRFFDINDLAALRMEREDVFEATHRFVLSLLAQGKIAGLRIDHLDGLFDPEQYFRRLQASYVQACARELMASDPAMKDITWDAVRQDALQGVVQKPLYVVAEKILALGEPLPREWLVDGTTGYDFLAMTNSVFVQESNVAAFTDIYRKLVPDQQAYEDLVYSKKKLILGIALASELNMLAHRLDRIAQADRHSRDFTLKGLLEALCEVVACFPVYRSYISERGVSPADRQYVETAIRRARERNPKMSGLAFDFIRQTLLLQYDGDSLRHSQKEFAGKFQQMTAPVTAKGIEDTTFYIYNRFVSLNEVGGDPDHFGTSPDALHAYLQDRQGNWPQALSPLTTHDTKRSEDVRARLNVLSEIPDEWQAAMERWMRINAPLKQDAPDANDEYLLYQTLVGAWPLEQGGEQEYATFIERIAAYMQKAMREAKVHTSWTHPNGQYEKGVQNFVRQVLGPQKGREFLKDFKPFQKRVSEWGLINSLSQTLLRLTAPGVPDTYQGTELWDFSLVDPDNRRPVDYAKRREMLRDLHDTLEKPGDRKTLISDLLTAKSDGRVKMLVTTVALKQRARAPGLFTSGDYIPAEASGSAARHVFAFSRRHGNRFAVVIIPRLVASLTGQPEKLPLGKAVWKDTAVRFRAPNPPRRMVNAITAQAIATEVRDGALTLRLADALADFPMALLVSE